jgi:hypothetical protein
MNIKLIIRTWFGDRFDGVIEAVRYHKNGQIEWVRAYERRGPTWSDHVLLKRDELVDRIKSGKRFYSGQRKENNASEFELERKVVLTKNGKGVMVKTEDIKSSEKDSLQGVPII